MSGLLDAGHSAPKGLELQVRRYWLQNAPKVDIQDGELQFPGIRDNLVLFNAPFPINEAEVASCLANMLNAQVIGREAIRNFAGDDELRTELWDKLSPSTQRALTKDGDVIRQLVARYGLDALQHNDRLRREIRMALLVFGLGVSGEKYIVSWGAGMNILCPEAIRFYFEFDQNRLAEIYGEKVETLRLKNNDKEKWYQRNFHKSRRDLDCYSVVLRMLPENIKNPADLNSYLAEFMANVINKA